MQSMWLYNDQHVVLQVSRQPYNERNVTLSSPKPSNTCFLHKLKVEGLLPSKNTDVIAHCKSFNLLGSVMLFQTLDDTERGSGGFGSTGRN